MICTSCGRWNLAPIDGRLERIEAVARAASEGRVAASTEQVSLIRWGAYDLVRVGKPRRLEYATWRYGERIKARRREQLKFVVPLTIAAMGAMVAINVAAGGSVGIFVWQLPQGMRRVYTWMVGGRLIRLEEPPICAHCGAVIAARPQNLQGARPVNDAHGRLGLLLTCPGCGREGAQLEGPDAQIALRRTLTYLNLAKRGRQRAEDAAYIVEGAGGAEELIRGMARDSARLATIRPNRRLAFEMAVDEQAEVDELERQWREAEETASIADGTLSSSAEIEDEMRRLKEKGRSQPNG